LRLNAIMRRMAVIKAQQQAKTGPLKFGRWTVDIDKGEMVDGTDRVLLTAVEHTLLRALVSRRGEVVSREDLAKLCQMTASERTIDVQVTRLRKKIEDDAKLPKYLQTVRGKGYVLWPEDSAS